MRTEFEIKRKLNELKLLLPQDVDIQDSFEYRIWSSINAEINILEWVLNDPTEKYHE